MLNMIQEQLDQLDNGFVFQFAGEEVVITGVVKHPLNDELSELRMCKTETYEIIGPFRKGYIAHCLETTGQADLLSLEVISAGKYLIQDLGLTKINIGSHKGHYKMSGKHRTWGGSEPKTLLEIGRIAIDSITKRDFVTWLHTAKNL